MLVLSSYFSDVDDFLQNNRRLRFETNKIARVEIGEINSERMGSNEMENQNAAKVVRR